jgi:hypothetical protein
MAYADDWIAHSHTSRFEIIQRVAEMVSSLPNNQRHKAETNYWFYAGVYAAIMTSDNVDGWVAYEFENALAALKEREQIVLELRLRYKYSLGETGKLIGITREGVRGIEMRAFRRLATMPQHTLFSLTSVYDEIRKISQERDSLKKMLEDCNEARSMLDKIFENHDKNLKPGLVPRMPRILPGVAKIPITDINLSARAYNVLIRSDIKTVEDIYNAGLEGLMRLRNTGRVTVEEIAKKLAMLGVTLE